MLPKTDFLSFLEAPMHLWAKAHDALEVKPHTPYQQHLIQQGQQVEALALEYLASHRLKQYKRAQLFWQPTFDDGRFETRADALILDLEQGVYDLYEIKSATSVHKNHEYDVAFQVLVLERELSIRHTYLLHIDKAYMHGEVLDLARFFIAEDITSQIAKQREAVLLFREAAWAVTQMAAPDPSFACTKPNTCPCPALCHPDLPEHPIYNLPRIGKKALKLRDMGITTIEDIPVDYPLNAVQSKHYQAVRTRQPVIDMPAIQNSLAKLKFPLYFLDYETFNPAIPLYPGYRPYEHIVFQYSLFTLQSPDADLQHHDCLILESGDPAQKFTQHLLDHLGPGGSVVIWNQSFEAGRNADLARHCPAEADRLLAINDRLYDLMEIFRQGLYVHPSFHGSASLKAVLPVLYPDLGYDNLEITNGEEAMLTWYWLQQSAVSPGDLAKIDANLRAYCKRDTFGMVAIWNILRDL